MVLTLPAVTKKKQIQTAGFYLPVASGENRVRKSSQNAFRANISELLLSAGLQDQLVLLHCIKAELFYPRFTRHLKVALFEDTADNIRVELRFEEMNRGFIMVLDVQTAHIKLRGSKARMQMLLFCAVSMNKSFCLHWKEELAEFFFLIIIATCLPIPQSPVQ